MGAYSEMNIEQQHESAPFAETDSVPTFEEHVIQPQQNIMSSTSQPVPTQASSAVQAETLDTTDQSDKASDDEDAKRKAHEESEANRKAEWDARQQQKKADIQKQLDRLAAMSVDEVMAASMKRVSTDTEKLTRRNMKDCVAEYIQTLCIEDPTFALKVMHPSKSMIRCFQHISRKAYEYVQDELKANGIQPGPGREGYGCDVPDDLCYEWAAEYFNDPDAKEDHEDEEKFVPRPYLGGTTSKSKRGTKGKKETASKKAEPKKTVEKKPSDDLGQIPLSDFMLPEEKAG